ncbi:MAG: heavy metal-associated domain-containing protein [Bacteroidota bacterium]
MVPIFASFRALVLAVALLFCAQWSSAQFQSATIVVDGLTCSMCSYGVERSLRKLEFVDDVQMDLNSNTAQVSFRTDREVMITALAKKVTDAGFSVRSLQATASIEHHSIPGDIDYLIGHSVCHFLESVDVPEGQLVMTFIGKEFMDKRAWKKWRAQLADQKGSLQSTAFLEAREYCFVTL